MPEQDLLITGGYVVTLDSALGDFPEADVLVRDGRIARIGPGLTGEERGARVIDARGRLVLPGLVDTHRHVWQGALGGATGRVSLAGYSTAVVGGLAPHYEAEDIHAGTLWGALQALNAGITTIADWSHNLATPADADANVEALRDSGIRGILLYVGLGMGRGAGVVRVAAGWTRPGQDDLSAAVEPGLTAGFRTGRHPPGELCPAVRPSCALR